MGEAEAALEVSDPGKPYLFVDLYPFDLGKHPPWGVVTSTPGFVGAILKAMDGTSYNDGGWFRDNWAAVRSAGADRYGSTWFRGAYLFLEFGQDGAEQADAYLDAVDQAGGWGEGDILPAIDVELGGEKHPNRRAGRDDVVDCVSACAERLRERSGRRVMLYGRGAMRDLGIGSKMGCDVVWNPAYTASMVRHGLEAWTLDDIVLWQYCGDGTAAIEKLPHEVPGFGKVDISVYVDGARAPTLQSLRARLL